MKGDTWHVGTKLWARIEPEFRPENRPGLPAYGLTVHVSRYMPDWMVAVYDRGKLVGFMRFDPPFVLDAVLSEAWEGRRPVVWS